MVYSQSSSSGCLVSPDKIVSNDSDCMKGDIKILCLSIERKREDVRQSRLALGMDLHRLGEHHVRNRQYREAMSAFSAALIEKQSATRFRLDEDDKHMSDDSSHTPSECVDHRNDLYQSSINEVLTTLSSLGTVHSLVGEHNEAMKCYSEITNIRSSFTLPKWQETPTQSCHDNNDETDSSDFHEEMNELDGLFRSISFRNEDNQKQDRKEIERVPNSTTSNQSHQPIQEIESVHCGSYSPWEQLEESLKDLEKTNKLSKEIGCCIEENDLLIIFNQVAVLQAEYQQNVELQENTESMREKCLYMSLLVRDKILFIQKHIVAFYLHHKEESGAEPDRIEEDDFKQASINVAATMITIGGMHYKLSNLNEELYMYKLALSTYREALGDCHPYVAGTRKNIGMVLAERYDFDGAMEQFEHAKEIYSKQNKDSICSDVASAISCMGNVQYRRGELDNALSLYSKALFIHRTLGEQAGWTKRNVTDVTSTLKIIGMVYTKRSDLESAMKCYEEAMELLVSLQMEKTVEAASLFGRMGGMFFRENKYDEAMKHYQNAYSVTIEALGTKNHPDVASIMHFIGIVHQKQSRLHEAMASYHKSIQIYRLTLGPDNPAKASTMVYIGSIHFHQKQYDEAMGCYKEALRLYETSYGQNHPQVGPTMKSIAMIHIKKEEYDEAMVIFQELLRRKCIVLGSYHPDVAYAHKCIGNIHFKRGEIGLALRQYKHAYEIYQRSVGDSHKETKSMKSAIANLRNNLMMQQSIQQRDDRSSRIVDRRAYKRRQLSASRYAY
jgi:tetratricopeptide (TPR) repeat protein